MKLMTKTGHLGVASATLALASCGGGGPGAFEGIYTSSQWNECYLPCNDPSAQTCCTYPSGTSSSPPYFTFDIGPSNTADAQIHWTYSEGGLDCLLTATRNGSTLDVNPNQICTSNGTQADFTSGTLTLGDHTVSVTLNFTVASSSGQECITFTTLAMRR